jgi:Flp pilus assembly pilin Flp
MRAPRTMNEGEIDDGDAVRRPSAGRRCNVTITDLLASARRGLAREEGQTMAEYGVVLSIAAAIIVAALIVLRGGIVTAIQSVVQWL